MKIEAKTKLEAAINVRTTKGVKQAIEKIAKDNNTSVNNLVNQILKNFILQNNNI